MRPAFKNWEKGSARFFLCYVSPDFTVVSADTPSGYQQGPSGDSVLASWIAASVYSISFYGATVSFLTSVALQVIIFPS